MLIELQVGRLAKSYLTSTSFCLFEVDGGSPSSLVLGAHGFYLSKCIVFLNQGKLTTSS